MPLLNKVSRSVRPHVSSQSLKICNMESMLGQPSYVKCVRALIRPRVIPVAPIICTMVSTLGISLL